MMLIIVFLSACTLGSCEDSINFPLQGGVKMENRDKPVFEFEGIDYENLPTKLKEKYTDCEAQNIRCIRHQVALTPICAVTIYGYWRDFHNICEFQRQNCYALRDKGLGKNDVDIAFGYIFLQGEGVSCNHEFRRLKDSGLLKIYLNFLKKTA